MKMGHLLEPVIAQLWEEHTGFRIVKASAKDIIYQDPDHPWRKCTPDRFAYEIGPDGKRRKVLLEFKSSAVDIDPDDLPANYVAQCQYQMHVTGVHVCYLCWLVNGRYYGHVRIEYDKEFAEWLVGEVDKFYNDCVVGGEEPDLISVNDFALKGSDPGTTIEVDADTLSHVLSVAKLNDEISTYEEMRDAHKDSVKLFMGSNESLVMEGKTIATWKTGARGRIFLLKNKNIEELTKNNTEDDS